MATIPPNSLATTADMFPPEQQGKAVGWLLSGTGVGVAVGIPGIANSLGFQNVPPGQHPLHQGPHAQLAGDGKGLVQQGHRLRAVARLVPLEQGRSRLTRASKFGQHFLGEQTEGL